MSGMEIFNDGSSATDTPFPERDLPDQGGRGGRDPNLRDGEDVGRGSASELFSASSLNLLGRESGSLGTYELIDQRTSLMPEIDWSKLGSSVASFAADTAESEALQSFLKWVFEHIIAPVPPWVDLILYANDLISCTEVAPGTLEKDRLSPADKAMFDKIFPPRDFWKIELAPNSMPDGMARRHELRGR